MDLAFGINFHRIGDIFGQETWLSLQNISLEEMQTQLTLIKVQ